MTELVLGKFAFSSADFYRAVASRDEIFDETRIALNVFSVLGGRSERAEYAANPALALVVEFTIGQTRRSHLLNRKLERIYKLKNGTRAPMDTVLKNPCIFSVLALRFNALDAFRTELGIYVKWFYDKNHGADSASGKRLSLFCYITI